MSKKLGLWSMLLAASLVVAGLLYAANVVPTDVQQPGTQPREIGNLETPDKCDNCHGGYDAAVEPAYNWRGSMMANATRDPLFWATLAIAEQDFDGAGDLCIRCHTTIGWLGGRSTPTDGSGLASSDTDGVDCDTCHKMTNPDRSEHAGVMNPPFVANDGKTPATGYFGSGMFAMSGGSAKLGPYAESDARHQYAQSKFHRSVDFCGSCHDVSNPVVGDLAHNNGAQVPLPTGSFSGVPGAPVDQKAAFKNFPFAYGVVERTFSEYKAGALSKTLVSNYPSLPADLKAGAIKNAYDTAKGNYADGTPRYFSCQTCHMKAVTGAGCNKKGAPIRPDLPLHDMTGGNYWVPDAILYQNTKGTLRLGGGLTTLQKNAIAAGKTRAEGQLGMAASLSVDGNRLRVTNLTGHKLISGYPEGRRMWLNIKWYDAGNNLVREDGRYGVMSVQLDGQTRSVQTILDLNDPNSRIYEAHYAMTKEWADQLLALGKPASLPLAFDRTTGAVTLTLGQLAALASGSHRETFHFVLNNHVAKDNRIPPYGMNHDEARIRNALPVPASQYGNPGPGGSYNYWDEVVLQPPVHATRATISLLYQPTSWEYIQFLYLANTRSNAFLANEGVNLLDAWLNTGMAAPYTMASVSATFTAPRYTLSVTGAGTGEGAITGSGISCTINNGSATGTCSASYDSGTVVALTATASGGSTFSGWGGACSGTAGCSVTMSSDTSVSAVFTVAPRDFNNDGHVDLVWRHSISGENAIWLMHGATYLSSLTIQSVADSNWRIAGAADFNADGHMDLLWRHYGNGRNAVWFMQGSTYLGGAQLSTVADLNWEIGGIADFNGDGRPDLLWRNQATGRNTIWLMNGTVIAGSADILSVTDSNWRVEGTGDFNGDGHADIIWRNYATGQNAMWFMNRMAYAAGAHLNAVIDMNWRIEAVGDFNLDGTADLVWRNYATGENAIWYMSGAHYLSGARISSVTDTSWILSAPR
jgi:hypothetical protein